MPHDETSRVSRLPRGSDQPRPIPTFEAKALWPLRMVCLMRRLFIVCGSLLLAASTALAAEPVLLEGIWVGTHDGQEIIWHVAGENRLRVDGRPGDFEIRGDTLVVQFDAPVQEDPDPGVREVAVYHFVASTPSNGQARLFVSGFDLGKQGAMLVLETDPASDLPDTEDAAPPAPPHSSRPAAQRTASAPNARPGTRH